MKFKLEYIWLDGYEPVANLRSKTKIVDFETEPTVEQLPLWNFDGSSTRQADGSSSDCFLQPVALFPDPRATRPTSSCARCCCPTGRRIRRTAAPRSRRPRRLVRLRAGVLPLPGRLAARVPAGGLPRAAGRVLHRRRLQERRRRRAADRRRAHRPLHRGRHRDRGRQRRGREGPVGVPDLRQGRQARRRRALDRALPDASPLRALRRRRQLPSEAARRRASTGTAPACTRTSRPSRCARSAARSTSRR